MGVEMITVAIYINDRCIRMIRAVNQDGKEVSTYKILENGRELKHYRKDGAVPLAIRMLEETGAMTDEEIFKLHLAEIEKEEKKCS